MSNNKIHTESTAKALDFGRALNNLVIPIPEIIASCIEAKALLMDLMDVTDDNDELEGIKFVNFTLSLCADFFNDALDEEAAKHTAAKRAAYLTKFREIISETIKNK